MALSPRFLAGPIHGVGAVGIALVAPLAMPGTAHSQLQFSGGGHGDGDISKRSLDKYGAVLGLDASQKEAVGLLFAGYQDSMKQVSGELDEAMRGLSDEAADGDHSGFMEKLPEIMRKNGERRAAIQREFLGDLRALLTPQQEQEWPRLERMRRRESGMRSGMVSGSGVDMVSLVGSLKLTSEDTKKLQETLDQYELDLDRVLVETGKEMTELDAKAPKGGGFPPDFESMRARMDKSRESALRVRELNQQYERKLGAMLPEAAREQLAREFKKQSFRQIYRESTPSRWIAAAEKFDDLDAQQRQSLKELRESYERDVASLNEQWASALEQAEKEGKAGGFMFMPGGGGGESEELKAARKARREMDEKFNARIKTALNEKQRDRLPKKRPAAEAGGNFVTAGGDGAVIIQSIQMDGDEGEEGETADVQIWAPGPR